MPKYPGANLLKRAFKVIAQHKVEWEILNGETTNNVGMVVKTYDTPVTIKGSIQPVPTSKYEQFGFDLKKVYLNFYTINNILGVARDYSGDRVTFNGVQFQVVDETEWFNLDGWNHALLVSADKNNA